jgi:hypothetical protein
MKMEIETEPKMEKQILINKHNFVFSKRDTHHYSTEFKLCNNQINISKIVNFELIKLIYDLNTDIYEHSTIIKKTEEDANCILVMKHFFKDIGMPKRYVYVNITKQTTPDKIIFSGKSIYDEIPDNLPIGCEQLPINNFTYECTINSLHEISVVQNVYFDKKLTIPGFVEKILGNILIKLFLKVKLFIENIIV